MSTQESELEALRQSITFPEFVELFNQERNWEISYPQYLLCQWLNDTDNETYRIGQAYREAGKTEIETLWIAWKLMRDPNWTVIICCANNKLANKLSRTARAYVERFWLTKHLVPTDGDQWQVETWTVNRDQNSSTPSVQATSIRSGFTGLHAHTLLADDVEISENVQTEEAREYLWERVGDLAAVCNTRLWVGTPHDQDTIYNKLQDLPQDYQILKIPVDDSDDLTVGNPANPDVVINGFAHDEAWIEMKMVEKSWNWFQANYRLKAVKSYDTLFHMDLINVYGDNNDERACVTVEQDVLGQILQQYNYTHYIEGEEVRDMVAFWDPAYGRRGRDDSVLCIVASTVKGDVYIPYMIKLEEVKTGDSFDEQCDEVLAALSAYGLERVWVESNFSAELGSSLKRRAKKKGQRIKLKEIYRTANQNKDKFIADNLDPLIRTGRLYVHYNVWHNTPFRGQLLDFPKSKKDDFIDAPAGAIDVLKTSKVKSGLNGPAIPFNNSSNRGPVKIN